MEQPRLVYPRIEHLDMVQDYVKETSAYGEYFINGSGGMQDGDDYEVWLKKEKQNHLGIHLTDGFVPGTTYYYVLGNKLIGMINIRHCLNEYLLQQGGHIGYSVVPSMRRLGHAANMLKKAIEICKQWDIYPILITCDKDNLASRKTIERCGGKLENEYYNEKTKETILRFWIGE